MASKHHQTAAHTKKPTPAQRRARADLSLLAAMWNDLRDDERQAWHQHSRNNRRGGRAARRRRRSGRGLFFKVNFHRLALEQKPLTHPNAAGNACPTPTVQLAITNRAGRVSLKLHISDGPAEGVVVSSWHPVNPGVMVWNKFVRLGPLPPPRKGACDLTRLYVEKYGLPPVGKKIFIRIQQMKDYLGKLFQSTSAIVPAEEGWDSDAKPQ